MWLRMGDGFYFILVSFKATVNHSFQSAFHFCAFIKHGFFINSCSCYPEARAELACGLFLHLEVLPHPITAVSDWVEEAETGWRRQRC